ncbi:hypothetical protein LUZ62_037173 [Rhynchospora pubera]|uniref:Meiotic nuclear division protein 1 n=1 Tax=Rhynchospora pubera TaxID=906938 RepID=A0AAV8F6U5_9POAL|nr:hypothetical protein LUZ62_037173 [Rhynchospora pubera]
MDLNHSGSVGPIRSLLIIIGSDPSRTRNLCLHSKHLPFTDHGPHSTDPSVLSHSTVDILPGVPATYFFYYFFFPEKHFPLLQNPLPILIRRKESICREQTPRKSRIGATPMSKKRGLSLEEKREQMLQIFYESQGFFLLKELEKMGPKKGVISQSVKDVIQSLVDDDLVLKDKIGTSVYFWSLPSCAGNQLRNTYKKLESDLTSSKKKYAELAEQRDSLKRGREESDEREAALEELKATELEHKRLKDELASYADNDPAALEAMKLAIEVAHSAANRWTDNIFTLQQWCSTTFPQAKEQLEHLYKEAGITEDFDYLP